MRTTSDDTNTTVHTVQCMEVWGGNQPTRSAIAVPGIDAWLSSSPQDGDRRGGDIYFASTCGGGRISRFVIADVSGHGRSVSKLAMQLRRLMKKHVNTLDQTRFARMLNHELRRLASDGHFATAILATYFAPTDHLLVCNAGHPLPLLYRAATGGWGIMKRRQIAERPTELRNLPFGLVKRTDYVQFAVRLAKGDIVVIYTDALIEARNPHGEFLGREGLLALARQQDTDRPQDLNGALLNAVAKYRGGAPSEDDETLLVLHHNAADPPKQSLVQKSRAMARMLGLTRSRVRSTAG